MNVFDKEGTGFLEKEVLEMAIQSMGDGLTQEEIQASSMHVMEVSDFVWGFVYLLLPLFLFKLLFGLREIKEELDF